MFCKFISSLSKHDNQTESAGTKLLHPSSRQVGNIICSLSLSFSFIVHSIMGGNDTDFTDIQNYLTRYGMIPYCILGNIGLFFNLMIFSQSTHRRNASSLYLLTSTICHLFCLNFGIFPYIYALYHRDLLVTSLIFCKIQFYFRHTPYQILRTLMILACVNRYISSNARHRLQAFNDYHTTLRCILIVVLFWLIVCSFIPILLSIDHEICKMDEDTAALIYSIYLLVFAGILPPILMTISSLFILSNLKKLRLRIDPRTKNTGLMRKRDRDYIRMLLFEILVYILTTLPYTFVAFYTTVLEIQAGYHEHDPDELFLSYMTRSFLLYLNNSLSFWIYILMSKTFRNEFKDLIGKWYSFVKRIFCR